MEESKTISTTMATGFKLSNDDESLEVDHTIYRSMIVSLLYVTTRRSYVMQDVGLVSRFQSTPKKSHVDAVKIIIRYIKGTVDYGLWYPKENNFTLKAFTDTNY